LHPHKSHDPFSNRSHNSHERRVGEEILFQLILLLKPRRLIAIGNEAAQTAYHLSGSHQVIQVRHPSYGGKTQFLKQIKELYALQESQSQVSLF
jgi:uracil-DNA glycosylase